MAPTVRLGVGRRSRRLVIGVAARRGEPVIKLGPEARGGVIGEVDTGWWRPSR